MTNVTLQQEQMQELTDSDDEMLGLTGGEDKCTEREDQKTLHVACGWRRGMRRRGEWDTGSHRV